MAASISFLSVVAIAQLHLCLSPRSVKSHWGNQSQHLLADDTFVAFRHHFQSDYHRFVQSVNMTSQLIKYSPITYLQTTFRFRKF